jgi:hypothetical protein
MYTVGSGLAVLAQLHCHSHSGVLHNKRKIMSNIFGVNEKRRVHKYIYII